MARFDHEPRPARATFTPAYFDGKNLTTEWLEELFDEQSALYGRHSFLGYINDIPTELKYSANSITFKPLDAEDIYPTIFMRLKDLLKDCEDLYIANAYGYTFAFYFICE